MIAIGLIASQALDERGQEYADAALKRSLLTFGVARALNGVISVAQGTEIALQPAGVGLTFTPGQILDLRFGPASPLLGLLSPANTDPSDG